MQGYNLTTVGTLILTSGGNSTWINQATTATSIANQQNAGPIDLVTLSSGGASRTLRVLYDSVDFAGRSLLNCSTINDLLTNELGIRTVARCRLTCTGGTYAMSHNTRSSFRAFVGSGLYISKIAAGRFTLLVDVAFLASDDFSVMCNGTSNEAGTTGGDTMLFSVKNRSSYFSSGVLLGYTFDVYTTKTNTPDSLVDIGNSGFIDVTVVQ